MGLMARFDLRKIKKEAGISHFIETGTWYGDSINYAIDSGFTAESCEINDKFCMISRDRFKDRPEVKIYQLASEKFLPIADEQLPSIFFLDAHLPNLYMNHESKMKFTDDIKLPLEIELWLLPRKQNFAQSIIIIDDLRIYMDSYKYAAGSIFPLKAFDVIKWFRDNAKESHDISVSDSDEGYLIAWPKAMKPIEYAFGLHIMRL